MSVRTLSCPNEARLAPDLECVPIRARCRPGPHLVMGPALKPALTWSDELADVQGLAGSAWTACFSIAPQDVRRMTGRISWPPFRGRLAVPASPCRLEFRLPGAPGRDERWFEASLTIIVQDGAAVQLLGVCRDVTERLRVNREVGVRARQQETLARLGERALTETDLQTILQRGGRHRRRDSRRRAGEDPRAAARATPSCC